MDVPKNIVVMTEVFIKRKCGYCRIFDCRKSLAWYGRDSRGFEDQLRLHRLDTLIVAADSPLFCLGFRGPAIGLSLALFEERCSKGFPDHCTFNH